jgi:hypothetical protein
MKWLWLLLALNSSAWSLSSAQLWSDGTRSVEMVPEKELDVTLGGRFPDAQPGLGGLRLEYGFSLFKVESMASLEWFDSFGGRRDVDFGLRQKLPITTLPLALYMDVTSSLAAVETQGLEAGLILGLELGDHEFALNAGVQAQSRDAKGDPSAEYGDSHLDLRLGYRGPYVTWTLRPGLEAHWKAGEGQCMLTPQLLFNLPGDVSIQCGVKFSAPDRNVTTLLLALSYEIFPSP